MSQQIRLPVQLMADTDDFARAAAGYRDGDPLPLLDGPLVSRDLDRLAATGVLWRPSTPERHPVGVVPGDPFAPVGRLLAVATGRPLRQIDLTGPLAARDGTLTVVVAPERLTPEIMEAARGPVGFFTARDLTAACALLVRTVLDSPGAEKLLFDPTLAYLDTGQRLQGPASSVERLTVTPPRGQHFAVAGRSHGRECMISLGPGTLCGRTAETTGDAAGPPTVGTAACQHSNECVRRDLDRRTGLNQPRARDLSASAVLLDSCRSIALNGRLGWDVSLALSALDGTAVVVAGCPGVRQGPLETPAMFVGLLAGGMPAAEVVHILNELAVGRALGTLVLLGDAARDWPGRGRTDQLTLEPGSSALALAGPTAVRLETDPGLRQLALDAPDGVGMTVVRTRPGRWWVVHPEGDPLTGVFRVDRSTTDIGGQLSRLVHPTLDMLARWEDQGLWAPTEKLGDLRARARALAAGLATPLGGEALRGAERELRELVRAILAIQSELADAWLERMEHGMDRYADQWPEPVRFGPGRPVRCPRCQRPAEHLPVVAGCNEAVPLFLIACPVCGEAAAGVDGRDWSAVVRAPEQVHRGEEIEVQLGVDGLTDPAVVCLRAGVQHSRAAGTVLSARVDQVVAEGGAVGTTVTAQIGRRAVADSQTIRMVAVVNGAPIVLSHTFWVRPRPFHAP